MGASNMFAKRVIAVFVVLAIAGVAYATSPLKQLPTYQSIMQLAAEPEPSPDIPVGNAENMEQAFFGGLDQNEDSFVSKEEFTEFLKGDNSDKGLEGLHLLSRDNQGRSSFRSLEDFEDDEVIQPKVGRAPYTFHGPLATTNQI